MDHPDDEQKDCIPLLKKIVKYIPEPKADPDAPFSMLVSNIEWDDYVGRVAIGKVLGGNVKKGDTIWLLRKDGTKQQSKVMKTFTYSGLATSDSEGCGAGGIVGIAAGIENIDIGETLAAAEDMEPLALRRDRPADRADAVFHQRRPAGRPRRQTRHLPRHPRPPDARVENQHLDPGRGHRPIRRLQCVRPRRDADRHPRRTNAPRGLRSLRLPADGHLPPR